MSKNVKTAIVIGVILLALAVVLYLLRKKLVLETKVSYFSTGDSHGGSYANKNTKTTVRYGNIPSDIVFDQKIKVGDKVKISGGSPYDGKWNVLSVFSASPPAIGGELLIDTPFIASDDTHVSGWGNPVWLAGNANKDISIIKI